MRVGASSAAASPAVDRSHRTEVEVQRTFTPDPASQERYEGVFAAHRQLHGALGEAYALVGAAAAHAEAAGA